MSNFALRLFLICGILTVESYASSCSHLKGNRLRVACTTECGWFNSWAVKSAAKELDVEVELVNIHGNYKLDGIDALIIPGGADINPKYYSKDLPPALQQQIREMDSLVKYSAEGNERDPFEFLLVNQFLESDSKIPLLGICRGMQMLTVARGIPLYVDIETQLGIKNPIYTIDNISVQNKDSGIYQLMQQENFWGVQLHHQGLHLEYFNQNRDQWPDLAVTAVSNEGKVAEVLEFKNRPVLGVQFHPEYTLGKVRTRIFSWLISKACENKR